MCSCRGQRAGLGAGRGRVRKTQATKSRRRLAIVRLAMARRARRFEQAGRRLVARVGHRRNQGRFTKEAFQIDLQTGTCTCPAGQVTRKTISGGSRKGSNARVITLRAFRFEAAVCTACSLRAACMRAAPKKGRSVVVHPQERLIQAAGVLRASPGVPRIPEETASGRAPHRAVDPTGRSQVALLWASQDLLPSDAGSHGGQPHAHRHKNEEDEDPQGELRDSRSFCCPLLRPAVQELLARPSMPMGPSPSTSEPISSVTTGFPAKLLACY